MAINIAIGSDDTSAEWGPDMVQQIHEQVRNKLFKWDSSDEDFNE